jgi:ribonuclease P protein component
MVERERRLRRSYEVRQTRSKGRPYADGPLVARIRRNPAQPDLNRYAVVAGKSVGGAVDRNRLKRLVREAVRHLDPGFRAGHDIVIIIRGRREELPSLSEAEAVLSRIARRAGLFSASGEPVRTAQPAASVRESPSHPEL